MKSKRLNQDDMLNALDNAFDQLEAKRSEELENARRWEEIQQNAARREQERLTRKYGPDHPRVQKLAVRVAYHEPLAKAMDTEQERSKTRTEPFEATSWRVHGQVTDRNDAPLKGHTVFLTDPKNPENPDMGYACTDERGQYSITLTEDKLKNLPNAALYLAVSDPNQRVIYQDTEPIRPTAGIIDYRPIRIGDDACQPPQRKKDEKKPR